MFEFYNELEEETEDFVGVEHVRVTKRYLGDWENPMKFCNEEFLLLFIIIILLIHELNWFGLWNTHNMHASNLDHMF